MISKAGVVLLDALVRKRSMTPNELANETRFSREHIYRVLDSLTESGLIEESRGQNNQRQVRVRDTPLVEAYRRLIGNAGHVQWPEILTPATIRVCWYLDEPRRVTTIAERLLVSRQAVHQALTPLKGRAMLSPSGPEYALVDQMKPLLAFARAFVTHEHRQRIRNIAPSATIEWCDPKRALVRTQRAEETEVLQSTENWHVTGLAGFRNYGLKFYLSGQPAFWYDPTGIPSSADLVCQTLVLNADPRRVSYALLLIEAATIEKETMLAVARWYKLESLVKQMYTALEEGFESMANDRLPSETEYLTLKRQYDVP